MQDLIDPLLALLSLPKVGLGALFVLAFVSATLLPIGSEPALFGLIKLNPELFWSGVFVATAGNTLGGALTWWMGLGAKLAHDRLRKSSSQLQALRWLERLGPKACLLSWLPVVGDPLCAVAGWLRLPFLPCVVYMAIGKFLRYVVLTALLLWVFPGRFIP